MNCYLKETTKDFAVILCSDQYHGNIIKNRCYSLQIAGAPKNCGSSLSFQTVKVFYQTLVKLKLTSCLKIWCPQLTWNNCGRKCSTMDNEAYLIYATPLSYRERLLTLKLLLLMVTYELSDILFFIIELKCMLIKSF